MHEYEKAISDEIVKKLDDRFLRIKDRAFAPLRVLRYRLILKKMRIALYGHKACCSCKHGA